jgi:uncharacterized LabA/DUF88 family protein
MIDRTRRVVLLIDYDNLQICASRDTPGRELQLTPVVQLAQRYGTVILARAYAEWNLSTERLAVYKAGIEPAFAPVLRTESDRSGKSLADTVMVAEGMDMLWTLSPEVVVLATSDKDLIPLVRVAKQRGAFVVVLGSDFTAIPLREMADDHITYRQLITDASGRFATEAGPGRQPAALPEPTRRRSRDRNGRERTLTTPAAGAPATARPEREAAPRPEREPAAPPPAGAEPVAPVTAGAPAEADASTGPRRRRRRGSRRRSDRVGVAGESAGAEGFQGESGADEDDEEAITPTTSAADIARASDATAEPPVSESSVVEAAPEVAAVDEGAAAPRSRRRRTRVRGATDSSEGSATAEEPSSAAGASPVPEQSADILPAPPPEATSTNGPTSDEAEPTAAPARRPRRVASASRGRTRRP